MFSQAFTPPHSNGLSFLPAVAQIPNSTALSFLSSFLQMHFLWDASKVGFKLDNMALIVSEPL